MGNTALHPDLKGNKNEKVKEEVQEKNEQVENKQTVDEKENGKEKGEEKNETVLKGNVQKGKGSADVDNDVSKTNDAQVVALSEKIKQEFGEDFDISKFNQINEKAKKVELLEKELREKEESLRAIKEKYEGKNPVDLFFDGDENSYKAAKLLSKNKDIDSQALLQAATIDPEQMNVPELVKLGTKLNSAIIHGGEAGLNEMLVRKYGINVENVVEDGERFDINMHYNKLDYGIKNLMEQDARNAKKQIHDLKNSVAIPDYGQKTDPEMEKHLEQSSQFWKERTPAMVENFNGYQSKVKIKKPDGEKEVSVKFSPDDSFKKGVLENLSKVTDGVVATDDSVNDVASFIQNSFAIENIDKIVSEAVTQGYQEAVDDMKKKYHNNRPIDNNGSQTPHGRGDEGQGLLASVVNENNSRRPQRLGERRRL